MFLLSSEERKQLQLQLVDRPKRSRKQFFELIGPSGPPIVAVASRKACGWRCEACGARVFGYDYSQDTDIDTFIAGSDLPQPVPQVFTVGIQPNVRFCVTADRWVSLVGLPGTRGLVSRPVGVVPDEEVIRNPDLKPRDG
jgi:hypothetical protein